MGSWTDVYYFLTLAFQSLDYYYFFLFDFDMLIMYTVKYASQSETWTTRRRETKQLDEKITLDCSWFQVTFHVSSLIDPYKIVFGHTNPFWQSLPVWHTSTISTFMSSLRAACLNRLKRGELTDIILTVAMTCCKMGFCRILLAKGQDWLFKDGKPWQVFSTFNFYTYPNNSEAVFLRPFPQPWWHYLSCHPFSSRGSY